MDIRWSWSKAGPLALLLAGLAPPVLGQMVSASVTGTVTDTSGAVLKGAAVVAMNRNTNIEYPTKSNDVGVYRISSLPVGSYVVRAEAQGFKTVTTNPFTLEVGQIARVDLKLEVGAVTEAVEVTGVSPILQTQNAVVGEVVTGTTAVALPLNNRNFTQLTMLVAGAQHHAPETFNDIFNSLGSGGRPYVNGQREQGNNFMVDGLDQNDSVDNGVTYHPSPDALAEIKVETNNYSAEYGNVAGAIVSAVLKSGTNAFHGSAFEYYRQDGLDANSWGNNRAAAEKSKYSQHIFGATLGGPLIKNKLFFFGNYQGFRRDDPGTGTTSVAPAEWRNGDFSSLLANGIVIRDPLTGQPFANNQIPASRISAGAQALLSDTANYPLPNRPGLDSNYVGDFQNARRYHQGDLKIDGNLGPQDNFWLRGSVATNSDARSKDLFPLILGGGSDSTSLGIAGNWTHVFGTATVNELRLGFTKLRYDGGTPEDWAGVGDYNANVGIPGTQVYPGLASLDWASSGITGLGSNAITDSANYKTFQIADKLTFSRGRHFFSTGVQLLHFRTQRHYAGNNGFMGYFRFSGAFSGFGFSDFLLDQVSAKGIAATEPWEHIQNRIGVYVQDDFKVNSNLTLNLGVRWEYTSPLVEKNDRQVNYDLVTGQAIFPPGAIPTDVCPGSTAGCVEGSNRGLYDAYYGGFEPRVGFAWTPNEKTVIRGAYGIVQFMEGTGANCRLTINTPFANEVNRTYTAAPGSITTGFADATLTAPGLGVGQLRAFAPDFRPQLTQQWNIFVERRLTNNISLNVGYVGSRGTHLASFKDINQPLPGTGDPSTWIDAELRRPELGVLPGATNIRWTASDANANYDGLQASLRRRRANGLEFLASYTFSKALTDNQGFYGPGWGGYSATHFNTSIGDGNQNSYDPAADYGPAWFSSKHTFSFALNYELPFGKDRKVGSDWSGAKQAVLGGWNVSTIISARSGLPITVTTGWDQRSLQPNWAYNRPDVVEGVNPKLDNGGWDGWINPAAFQDAALGTFGNSGVGILRGPGFWNMDLSIDKEFYLGGSRSFALRVEAFNVLNHANLGMPVRDFTNKQQFGTIITTTSQARVLELVGRFRF